MTCGLVVRGLVTIGMGAAALGAQVGTRGQSPELVNLGRLPIARVFSSGGNPGATRMDGVRSLFDGNRSVNQTIYSSMSSAGMWVVVRFSQPVTVHRVTVEAASASRPGSQGGNFTVTLRTDGREIDSPSVRLPAARTSYRFPQAQPAVREVFLSFRGPRGPVELAEIEIMGTAPPGAAPAPVTPPVDPDALRELTAGHADRAAKLTWKRTELAAIRQMARPRIGQMRALRAARRKMPTLERRGVIRTILH